MLRDWARAARALQGALRQMDPRGECWEKLKKRVERSLSVIYGEGGSGKTSFALTLAREGGFRRVGYVNTEGEVNASRVLQILDNSVDYLYAEADSLINQLIAIMELHKAGADIVIVDSINSLYRLETQSEPESAAKLFTFTLALMKSLSREMTAVATSQVTLDEGLPVGLPFIKRYADNMIKISRREAGGAREIYLDGRLIGEGYIEGRGFRWTHCRLL